MKKQKIKRSKFVPRRKFQPRQSSILEAFEHGGRVLDSTQLETPSLFPNGEI